MILRRGVESPDVLNLEQVLAGLNFTGFDVDGKFDEKTENVVKYIQKSHGFVGKDIDGVVGPKTFALLDELYEPLVANFAPRPTPVVVPVSVPQDDSILDARIIYPKGDEELEFVHPILARKVLAIVDMAFQEGYNLTVVQGRRTFAEQNKLFAQRPRVTKARGGQSYHNYGVAVDLAFIVNGKLSWDEKLYKNIGRWASRVGLEWGGVWHFVDYPHLQLLNMPGTGTLLAAYNKAGGGNVGVQAAWRQYVR